MQEIDVGTTLGYILIFVFFFQNHCQEPHLIEFLISVRTGIYLLGQRFALRVVDCLDGCVIVVLGLGMISTRLGFRIIGYYLMDSVLNFIRLEFNH